jgi:hypothetical protein
MVEMKTCNRCKQYLPATAQYFRRSTADKDGLSNHCKQCGTIPGTPRNYKTRRKNGCLGFPKKCQSKELVKGTIYCSECLARVRTNRKKQYQRLRETGLCHNCGKTPPESCKTLCSACTTKANEKSREKREQWRTAALCIQCGMPAIKSRCQQCIDKANERRKIRRDTVYAHYGNKCACCGETIPAFLTIDHINNDGAIDRKTFGVGKAHDLHANIIRQGFPDTYQILCWNCNCGKHRNGGICPHKSNTVDLNPDS